MSRRPSNNAFVMPRSKTIYLWDEDEQTEGATWIKIKERINYGDENAMAGKVIKSIKIPEESSEEERQLLKREVELMLDISIDGPFKILVWVQDWNLKDERGKDVDLDFDSVKALDLEWADEINRVINEHEEATGQGKARKKKKPS